MGITEFHAELGVHYSRLLPLDPNQSTGNLRVGPRPAQLVTGSTIPPAVIPPPLLSLVQGVEFLALTTVPRTSFE